MKKITTLILLFGIALNVFAQQEIPMFFDNELMLQTNDSWIISRELAAYSPDGSKIATVFGSSKIVIWDAATGREITRIDAHIDYISGIVFSPNGRQLALFSRSQSNSNIGIWNAQTGVLICTINQSGVFSASFSSDGNRIAGTYYMGDATHGVKIWNTANGSEIRTLVGHTEPVQSVTYSPDGRNILTASDDGSMKIWDAGNGQTLKTIRSNGKTSFDYAIYSSDGRRIATYVYDGGNRSNTIRIFNVETGQEIRTFPIQINITDSANPVYSPDGRQLFVNVRDTNRNTIIKIFDPETGRELRTFNNGDHAIAFSPNGQRILTASDTFRLKIEDKNYGASYATLLDATTGKVTGTIGYGPLNVGARAYADMQIARFLGDTAAVNRHEAVLQFITGRGNATRAQIEKFYRDNVRALIAAVVDEEFNKVSFLLENSRTFSIARSHNAVLTRNPQNGYLTLSYGGYYTNNETRTITANSLEALASEMGRRTSDFDQTGINAVRAQAALIPAVALNNVALDDVKTILTAFYTTPNTTTYNAVKEMYALFIATWARSGQRIFENIRSGCAITLSELNPALAKKVWDDANKVTSFTTLTRDQQQRLVGLR